jgi:hypothetical protein
MSDVQTQARANRAANSSSPFSMFSTPPAAHYVGEHVRIREYNFFDRLRDRDGLIEVEDEVFLEEMAAQCGKWARITGKDAFGSFLINLDGGAVGWSGGMFEDRA